MTTFVTHSSGQVIASADINAIQTAVVALEGKVSPNAALHGFQGWSFDPWMSTATNTGNVGVVYTFGVYLPTCTVTNTHCYVITGGLTTHFALALYNAAGTLLSQTADKVADGNVTGLKTYALGSPQAVASGYYYIAMAFTGASPTFFSAAGTNSALLNAAGASPPIGFRNGSSATAYATTMPSPLGVVSTVAKPFWVACS